MQDEKLKKLSEIDAPAPLEGARKQALDLAMAAFDEAAAEKSRAATQGSASGQRLTSIMDWMKGLFAMENRYALTAAVTGLLLLPLGYLLYQNTALTPIGMGPQPPVSINTPSEDARGSSQSETGTLTSELADDESLAIGGERDQMVMAEEAPMPEPTPSVAPAPQAKSNEAFAAPQVAQQQAVGTLAMSGAPQDGAGMIAPSPMPGYQVVPEGAGDQFTEFDDSGVKVVAAEPVSTFSIDVDKASYAYVRRALNDGYLPQADAVRVEELINYFSYDYPLPADPNVPFATDMQIVPSPWDAGKQLLRIGVQGFEIPAAERPAANLVFLIDTSGSMNDQDKLPLLIKSFSMMLDALGPDDKVSIVAYAGSAGTVLEPTPANEKRKILSALRGLSAGGSTAGAEGIELAYQLAEEAHVDDGVNQVILATDGDFNVGLSDPSALEDFIAEKRDEGTFLSVLGFGNGNLNDGIMQALAQNGNGAAYYIDTLREARTVLVDNIATTLVPIAKDVKIQVEFNPAEIAEYRLIGYETRALNREDFNNDKVDAGDVGAGASVTAIYELTPVGSQSVLVDPLRYGDGPAELTDQEKSSGELAFFKLRYKLPDEDNSHLITMPVTQDIAVPSLADADANTRFAVAVASFGQKLRHNVFVDQMSWDDIRDLAAGARGGDPDGYRAEFLSLVDLAKGLSAQ
ncbi:MAG: VWA domain-containing protein [Hyphomicrobiaceae bacterium]|nr:VWA domain-containing protein [Hyphomicrobiaceae bacterium]MCC0024244.1 VWA domain-containing protein [Hyphomicrobiaceae bacterium]